MSTGLNLTWGTPYADRKPFWHDKTVPLIQIFGQALRNACGVLRVEYTAMILFMKLTDGRNENQNRFWRRVLIDHYGIVLKDRVNRVVMCKKKTYKIYIFI